MKPKPWLVLAAGLAITAVVVGCHMHVHLPAVQFGGGTDEAGAITATRPASDDPAFDAVIEEMLK